MRRKCLEGKGLPSFPLARTQMTQPSSSPHLDRPSAHSLSSYQASTLARPCHDFSGCTILA